MEVRSSSMGSCVSSELGGLVEKCSAQEKAKCVFVLASADRVGSL